MDARILYEITGLKADSPDPYFWDNYSNSEGFGSNPSISELFELALKSETRYEVDERKKETGLLYYSQD